MLYTFFLPSIKIPKVPSIQTYTFGNYKHVNKTFIVVFALHWAGQALIQSWQHLLVLYNCNYKTVSSSPQQTHQVFSLIGEGKGALLCNNSRSVSKYMK